MAMVVCVVVICVKVATTVMDTSRARVLFHVGTDHPQVLRCFLSAIALPIVLAMWGAEALFKMASEKNA